MGHMDTQTHLVPISLFELLIAAKNLWIKIGQEYPFKVGGQQNFWWLLEGVNVLLTKSKRVLTIVSIFVHVQLNNFRGVIFENCGNFWIVEDWLLLFWNKNYENFFLNIRYLAYLYPMNQ